MAEEEERTPPPPAMTSEEEERERKKALLVYKTNQHSASDDDEEDDEEEEEEEQEEDDNDRGSAEDEDDEEDARSVRSDGGSVEEEERHSHSRAEEEEEEDDLEEEDDVRVEKDDDESVNAPSDDDLESTTATPRHDTDDDENKSEKDEDVDVDVDVDVDEDTEDSATESKAAGCTAADSSGAGAGGSKLNVEEIIAARRRTGARKECDVCHEGRNGRRAMLCANCKTMYHSSCYRKKYNKLISATGKQWFCPDCEPARKAASPEKTEGTPRKKKGGVSAAAAAAAAAFDERPSKGVAKEAKSRKSAPKGGKDHAAAAAGSAFYSGDLAVPFGSSLLDQELSRVTEIAMRSGKKINGLIIERTDEMLSLTQMMAVEIEHHMGSHLHAASTPDAAVHRPRSILHLDAASTGSGPLPPLSALAMISSAAQTGGDVHHNGATNCQGKSREAEAKDSLLRSLHEGLFSLKNMLEQLQVTGIQHEVDLIRDIKVPPAKEEPKHTSTVTARKSGSSSASRSSSGNAAAKQAKPGASRLYSAKQIQKLEEWYQKSSRPEAGEIQAMYRIINSPDYADKELQPDGISVKQIRIWFDNRRAKERLDYMRIKMKDISTSDMDADDVKRMKAAYIDEAKEVLEARVSRLKENGKTVPLIDEADTLLLQSSERPLPISKTNKASPAAKSVGAGALSAKDGGDKSSLVNQKKRIRIDYVASVRKAVKDARDAGKSEEEMKLIKTAAIERARERLHVPYKNARMGPTKPLGKDEVSHIKMTMLKLLEEDAPAEELTDVVELLLSVIIPRDVLVESQLHRQLNLVLKAHKDNKELVKQTNKLLDEFNTIIEKGDEALYDDDSVAPFGDAEKSKKKKMKKDSTNLLLSVDSESLPGTPGASPDSPGASPDHRKSRVKFSRDQLMKLERHFYKEDTPSKKNLEKLSKKLNEIAANDRTCDGQGGIDYKQIRSWFYKRRSTNQPPQALSSADLRELKNLGPPSSSSSASETESDSDSATAPKPTKSGKSKASAKRKAGDEKPSAASNKRQKKSESSVSGVSKKDASNAGGSGGKQHSGRIFNVKQLATIIEEYEKNPRPTVARLEELQKILNQDDHADDHFVNPLGVTKRQIKTWFSNRRAKERLEVIRMKVSSGDKSSSKGQEGDDESVGSQSDDDDDDDLDEDQPIKKLKSVKAATSAAQEAQGAGAKKELFTSEGNVGGHDNSDVEDDDDDDDDVDMGSDDDDEGDEVEKDSDDDVDDDDDDDDDDDNDDMDDDE